MPFYTVAHAVALSEKQEGQIAQALTRIHSEMFTTPSLFVNVLFQDDSKARLYVAGELSRGNYIMGITRSGGDRRLDDFHALCHQMEDSWAEIVGTGPGKELRGVFINGSLTAGVEQGVVLPQAGGDTQWMKNNYAEFKKRADAGSKEFQSLIHEVHTRDRFRDALPANATTNGHA